MARGRPINQKISRPDCPLGHEGHTVLNGHYASPDKRFERPRFVCVPKDKLIPRHQFTAPLQPRHVVDASGDHSECAVCERPLHRSEGHVTPHYFRYAVHDLALLLDKLANGRAYRAAALEVRATIGRAAKRGRIKGVVGDSASPAIHALDIFGPIVAAEGAPARWPRVVIIDTIPLKRRRWKKRSRWNRRPAPGAPKPTGSHPVQKSLPWPWSVRQPRQQRKVLEVGRVYSAVGYDNVGDKKRPLLARWLPSADELSALSFLRSLPTEPGHEPQWVVVDRDKAMDAAIRIAWPNASIYYCEEHLKGNAHEALDDDVHLLTDQDMASLRFRVEYAFWDAQRYQDAVDDARQYGASNLLNWLLVNQQIAIDQEQARAGLGRVDRSTAVVEALLATVWARIEKRRHYFQNADRLNRLLDVIVADIDGRAGVQRLSRILRTHLLAQDGLVKADWHDAPMDHNGLSSIHQAVGAAVVAKRRNQYRHQRQRTSAIVKKQWAARRARRIAMGIRLPKDQIPKRMPAKGSVAGLTVADFAWLLPEWHPTKNLPVKPEDVSAGVGDILWWKCPNGPDHEWPAQVRSRTIRGVRCKFCTGRAVAPSQSIATTHPKIAAEWHPTRNGSKRPTDFIFDMFTEVWWQCPKAASHMWTAKIVDRCVNKRTCPKCDADRRRRRTMVVADQGQAA